LFFRTHLAGSALVASAASLDGGRRGGGGGGGGGFAGGGDVGGDDARRHVDALQTARQFGVFGVGVAGGRRRRFKRLDRNRFHVRDQLQIFSALQQKLFLKETAWTVNIWPGLKRIFP